MDKIAFGQKIAELRRAKGYSQDQLALVLGLSYQAVSKWETGKSVPGRTVCEKLSGLLGFDVDSMIHENLTPDEAGKIVEKRKEALWEKAEERLKELFGDDPPLPVMNRFIMERNMLYRGKSVILFDILAHVREAAKQKPARFDAAGCECFVSWLLGATDVNPMEPHLRCPKCRRTEFHPEVQSGWDLKEQRCECGGRMIPDGQDIPVETCLLGEEELYESFRCETDVEFLNEAERIILTLGEPYFEMEKVREEGGKESKEIEPETGEWITVQTLPVSSLIFRPKRKAKVRKPERISGPAEIDNWGENTGNPSIVLFGGFIEPYYLLKPTPYEMDPADLVQQPVMERALRDYWENMNTIVNMRTNLLFPDLEPYLGKLTFGKFVTLLCSVNNLYMTSGPEELAETTGFDDLTELPLSMEDLWKLISRRTAYPGYMSGAAGEILQKVRQGRYLVGPYLPGIHARDRKLFREMNLPDWFEAFASNTYALCFRSVYIDLGMRLLDDARRKIRNGK